MGNSMEGRKKLSYIEIENFVTELFTAGGMAEEDAKWLAITIRNANLRGIDSHGILRVPEYFDRMMCKAINPRPNIAVTQLSAAVSMVEADGAAGCISAKKAMELAIDNAKICGIGMAGVKNSNHFGTAAQYSQIAVDQGMIGISMTNVPTLIAAPGVTAKLVGNNPFAMGVPTYSDFSFLLDMSLSVVAEGKLRFAAANGSKIPNTWAADENGNPTNDPEEALKGFLLPVGGFKGLGIAYAVDILCGVITGGVFADKIKSMYRNPMEPSEIGHMMIAINLPLFLTAEEMKERMTRYHEYVMSAPVAEGASPLCFPGEPEERCEKLRREQGIEVPLSVINRLNVLKEKYELTAQL